MEKERRVCPVCGLALVESDGFYTCAEHGDWYSYSPNLLVRAPSSEAKAAERVLMPWERLSERTV
jgi:uncharacterized Zn finger protein (UPF0148 family)